jgi:hypothetical protein
VWHCSVRRSIIRPLPNQDLRQSRNRHGPPSEVCVEHPHADPQNKDKGVPSFRAEHPSVRQCGLSPLHAPRAKTERLPHAQPQATTWHHLAGSCLPRRCFDPSRHVKHVRHPLSVSLALARTYAGWTMVVSQRTFSMGSSPPEHGQPVDSPCATRMSASGILSLATSTQQISKQQFPTLLAGVQTSYRHQAG